VNKSTKINTSQKQLSIKWKCDSTVFKGDKNVFMQSADTFFEIISFGTNAVIRVDVLIYKWCVQHFSEVPANRIMDGENLFAIEKKLREFGKKLGGEHIRYLYLNNDSSVYKPSNYEYRLFDKENIKKVYVHNDFDNALNYFNDVIALGAYEGNKLVALAGADDSMSNLWQVGIDTLREYRNKGLATYLVKTLADEIESCGALPYYTTWSANIASTRVALSAGFSPVWVGYHAENI
jgi:GNAT superfamily N-acetyltransferase